MTGPFAASALDLRAAGWRGVLPLPQAAKYPPPKGYTGIDGRDPSGADVWTWIEGREASGNVALRLPDGVVGLDVDAYDHRDGAATLTMAERRRGALPATWRVTSRTDGTSGVRLYRVPAGRRWVGTFGPGTEVVQRVHRYVVAPPSIHPHTGEPYRWAGPDGETRIPRPDELPALPDRWVETLAVPDTATRSTRTRAARGRRPRPTAPAQVSASRFTGKLGPHHPDWVTAQLDDHLRQYRRAATTSEARDLAETVGYLGGQAVILRLIPLDDFVDRFAAATARTSLSLADARTAGDRGIQRAKLAPWRLAATTA